MRTTGLFANFEEDSVEPVTHSRLAGTAGGGREVGETGNDALALGALAQMGGVGRVILATE